MPPTIAQPSDPTIAQLSIDPISQTTTLRRTSRPHHQLRHLQDYFCGIVHSVFLPSEHHALVSALAQYHEPTCYEEAFKDPGWVQAMQKEIEALNANNTWDLVSLPAGKKATGSK